MIRYLRTPILVAFVAASLLACGDDGGDDGGDVDAANNVDASTETDGGDSDAGDGDAGATDARRSLRVEWVANANLVSPESAVWDSTNQVWYISNIGQPLVGPSQPGFITRLDADGTVMDPNPWVSGLGDPKGMAILGGELYVADNQSVVVIDIAGGTVDRTVQITGSLFLNDVAAGPAEVYISDTQGNAIYRLQPDDQFAVFVQDDKLDSPNGIVVEQDRLVVASVGPFAEPNTLAPLQEVALDDQEVTRIGTLEGKLDGIEPFAGGYLVTDFRGQVYQVAADGSHSLLIDLMFEHSLLSTADLGFDPVRQMAMIPDLSASAAVYFTIP